MNELLFLISIVVGLFFVFFTARRGLSYLLCLIVVNILLVSIFGGKLLTVFGLTTNIGNVFYACVFLATHFIVERYGKDEGLKTIWLGISFTAFFTIMSQLSSAIVGLPVSDATNSAIIALFGLSIRVTIASMLAFIFAQYLNIHLYEYIKEHTRGKFLWLRINGSNIVAQLLDSLLFFTIAFPALTGPLLIQAILVGWLIKSVVVLMGTPLFYVALYLEKKHD